MYENCLKLPQTECRIHDNQMNTMWICNPTPCVRLIPICVKYNILRTRATPPVYKSNVDALFRYNHTLLGCGCDGHRCAMCKNAVTWVVGTVISRAYICTYEVISTTNKQLGWIVEEMTWIWSLGRAKVSIMSLQTAWKMFQRGYFHSARKR